MLPTSSSDEESSLELESSFAGSTGFFTAVTAFLTGSWMQKKIVKEKNSQNIFQHNYRWITSSEEESSSELDSFFLGAGVDFFVGTTVFFDS